MEPLGLTLKDLINKKNKMLSIPTVYDVITQLIERLKVLHNKGFTHNDIKPGNIMTGFNDPQNIYLIDFGLATKFVENGEHIPFKCCETFSGNLEFSSINVCKGIHQTRRDDI